jgi:serine/threonine protein kinase
LLLLLPLLLLRHGLVHMDLSPDNILLDKEFVSQEQVS